MLDLSVPTSGQVKFGLAVCYCGKEFTKRRHGHRFCSVECKETSRHGRSGRRSSDPRHVAKRGRLRRLQAVHNVESSAVREGQEAIEVPPRYPYTGNGGNHPKFYKKISTLQEAISPSSIGKPRWAWPVDLVGGQRNRTSLDLGLLRSVTGIELASVPVVAAP